jgi:spore coat polysaccharide biosynthesis predicted glycosyltransferase SpsG
MKALFFAEGGPGVGLGHLRRCAALAEGMERAGWECRFLARDAAAADWLGRRGLALAPSSPASAGRLPDADYACDAFIVDSYAATNEEIVAKAKDASGIVLAFDDHMNRHLCADVVLNAGVLAPELDWPGRVERLLGPRYQPLADDCRPPATARPVRPLVSRVLVTLGGSGRAAELERVVAAVRRVLPGSAVSCVVGPFAEEPARLADDPSVALVRAPESLVPLMRDCDLAVAASGQTLFELAATGTPTVCFAVAENQRENLRGMERAGCVLSAGGAADPDFESVLSDRLAQAVAPAVRRRLAAAGPRLVDGRGADRVAEALASLLSRRRAAR